MGWVECRPGALAGISLERRERLLQLVDVLSFVSR